MDVEYVFIKNDLMNSQRKDIVNNNNNVSLNRSGNDSLLYRESVFTRQWYIYALFIALIILSLSLNAVVIIVCIRASLRKHPTNLYFLNLAIGDSGIALFMIKYLHNMDIPWTDDTCQLFLFIQMFITIFSLNTLLLVAVERFVAVRLPMHFQAFTTQRCIIRQLCVVWLLSAVEVLYPTLSTSPNVDVSKGCYGERSGYHLTVLPPSTILMFVLYISILLKLRQRQSQSTKIASAKREKEGSANSEHSCEVPLKNGIETHFSGDVVSDSNNILAIDNIDTDLERCNIDTDNSRNSNIQDIPKPIVECDTATTKKTIRQCWASSVGNTSCEALNANRPPIANISEELEIDIPPAPLSPPQSITSTIGQSMEQSVQTSGIECKLRKNIPTKLKQKARSSIDQRNKKAILLVLAIFLLMIGCHAGILFTVIYASIYNLGQEYVYIAGDAIVLPYVIHTCITPVLQLRFNDVVRQGLPSRFHHV